MKIEDLGYNETFEKLRIENNFGDFEIGRVIAEHIERYIVKTINGEFEAEITGNLRYSAKNREDFPAIGDWVAFVQKQTCRILMNFSAENPPYRQAGKRCASAKKKGC